MKAGIGSRATRAFRRAGGRAAVVMVLGGLLAGCAGTSDPVRYYQLRGGMDARDGAGQVVPQGGPWQLQRVAVPAYLDRDAILVAEGRAGLQVLTGHRWAEPLKEAIPRLLHADLTRLLGPDRVWPAAMPSTIEPAQRWLVDVLELHASAGRDQVMLKARWTILGADGAVRSVRLIELTTPTQSPQPDDLVAAHRQVLSLLAAKMVQNVGKPEQATGSDLSVPPDRR